MDAGSHTDLSPEHRIQKVDVCASHRRHSNSQRRVSQCRMGKVPSSFSSAEVELPAPFNLSMGGWFDHRTSNAVSRRFNRPVMAARIESWMSRWNPVGILAKARSVAGMASLRTSSIT